MKTYRYIILSLYYIATLISMIINQTFTTANKLPYLLLCMIMPVVLELIAKILKIKINDGIRIFYYLFTGFAMIGGNTLNFYAFPYFDKILHCVSGVLISLLCLMMYGYHNKTIECVTGDQFKIELFFTNGCNMLIAFLWECFEFALLVFFNNDAIHHYDQGVFDTMTDMIVCFIGGLVVSIFIYRYYKTKKPNVLINTVNTFISDNT